LFFFLLLFYRYRGCLYQQSDVDDIKVLGAQPHAGQPLAAVTSRSIPRSRQHDTTHARSRVVAENLKRLKFRLALIFLLLQHEIVEI